MYPAGVQGTRASYIGTLIILQINSFLTVCMEKCVLPQRTPPPSLSLFLRETIRNCKRGTVLVHAIFRLPMVLHGWNPCMQLRFLPREVNLGAKHETRIEGEA